MKLKRHAKILELVHRGSYETQDELLEALKAAGFKTTQATISRDIRELGLIKTTNADGTGQKYVSMAPVNEQITDRLFRIFKDGVVSMDYAQNIIIIKTLEGMAMAVAAGLDAMNRPELVGTIAGDNTIFCAVRTENDCLALLSRLRELIRQEF